MSKRHSTTMKFTKDLVRIANESGVLDNEGLEVRHKGRRYIIDGIYGFGVKYAVASIKENRRGRSRYLDLRSCTVSKETVASLIAECPDELDRTFWRFTGLSKAIELKETHLRHKYIPTIIDTDCYHLAIIKYCKKENIPYFNRGKIHGEKLASNCLR